MSCWTHIVQYMYNDTDNFLLNIRERVIKNIMVCTCFSQFPIVFP